MQINWKTRFQHGPFLVALFSLALILIQQVAAAFGYGLTETFNEQATGLFNTALSILVLLGVVSDPSTTGIADSTRALRYKKPAPNTKADDKLY